jgi:hypothetical protein
MPQVHKIDRFDHVTVELRNEYISAMQRKEQDGLEHVFEQLRKEARGEGAGEDHTKEQLTRADLELIHRLLKANDLRRQHFQYWKRYKSKSTKAMVSAGNRQTDEKMTKAMDGPSARPSTQSAGSAVSRPTQHSEQPSSRLTSMPPLPADFQFKTLSSSKPSATQGIPSKTDDGLTVLWPLPPIRAKIELLGFECPYCFFLCPQGTTREHIWRWQGPDSQEAKMALTLLGIICGEICSHTCAHILIVHFPINCTTISIAGTCTNNGATVRFGYAMRPTSCPSVTETNIWNMYASHMHQSPKLFYCPSWSKRESPLLVNARGTVPFACDTFRRQ